MNAQTRPAAVKNTLEEARAKSAISQTIRWGSLEKAPGTAE
jgi:hypothetical protein